MPTSEQLILERLRLCHLDISGVISASELFIQGSPSDGILPFVEVGIGPHTTDRRSEGFWDVSEQFIGIAYLAKTTASNTPNKGNQGLVDAVPYVERFRRYYMEHPYLHTSALDKLSIPWVRPVGYQQTTMLEARNDIYAFEFQVTITWREFATRS